MPMDLDLLLQGVMYCKLYSNIIVASYWAREYSNRSLLFEYIVTAVLHVVYELMIDSRENHFVYAYA